MHVDAIVLDMDGLMLDTECIYRAAWQQASTELGYDLDDLSYLKLVGRDTEECERALVEQFGSAFPMASFRARWTALWRERVDGAGIPAKAGLTQFLSFLEYHELPTAIATSSDAQYAEFSLGRAGLLDRFIIVVTGDQVTHGKPAPDIYLEAARRLGVAPQCCVALEDSDSGILAASRAGMTPLLIPDLKPPSTEAAAAAFRVLRSLDEARELLDAFITTGPHAKRS